MTTLASCPASSITIALPIPLLPPVTMATLFLTDMVVPMMIDANRCPSRIGRRGRSSLRFGRRQARGASTCRWFLCSELIDEIGDEPGPPRLVRRAAATAIVAVKVLMKQDVVFEIGVGLEFSIVSENGTLPVGTAEEELCQPAAQLIGNFVERQHDA